MTKEIVIYGGSFNPPHLAHVEGASIISQHFDELWLMPCYGNPYKNNLVDPYQRAEMCKIAIEGLNKINLCLFEVVNQLNEGSYVTLKKLSSIFPQIEFSFMIGQDCATQILDWTNSEKLRSEFRMVVVSRGGNPPDPNAWYMKSPHKFFSTGLPDIGSTNIRNLISSNSAEAKKLLHPGVYKYVLEHGYWV